jgi:hypothetical protein
LEIDARVLREDTSASAGVDIRLGSETTLGFGVRQADIRYAEHERYFDTSLRESLSRRGQFADVSLHHTVSPLTRLVVRADERKETFPYAPLRNGRSFRVLPGVEFDTLALVPGRVSIGYRWLDFGDETVPDYVGVVGAIDLSYTAFEATRFRLTAERDVEFSFETTQPYFLRSDLTAAVRQQLFGPWDVEARGAYRVLDYRSRRDIGAPLETRRDRVVSAGGGFGFQAFERMRVSMDVDRDERVSIVSGRGYVAVRIGTTVNYEF